MRRFVLALAALLTALLPASASQTFGMLGAGVPTPSAFCAAITNLGLTTNLKVCLDPGVAASYTSGTKWLDLSGNGEDFFLGTDGTTAAPTFTGTVGYLDAQTYWLESGATYHTYDTTNPAWVETLHQDNAIFTILAWVYYGNTGNQRIIGDVGVSTAHIGMFLNGRTTGFQVYNAGTSVANPVGATLGTAAWSLVGIALNEVTGASGYSIIENRTITSGTSTYTLPSALTASFTLQLGAAGNANTPLTANSRLGPMAVWQGTRLTDAQMQAIYDATASRFGR